jgi:hypothetical protein
MGIRDRPVSARSPNRARAFVADLGRATPSICSSLSFRQGQVGSWSRLLCGRAASADATFLPRSRRVPALGHRLAKRVSDLSHSCNNRLRPPFRSRSRGAFVPTRTVWAVTPISRENCIFCGPGVRGAHRVVRRCRKPFYLAANAVHSKICGFGTAALRRN